MIFYILLYYKKNIKNQILLQLIKILYIFVLINFYMEELKQVVSLKIFEHQT